MDNAPQESDIRTNAEWKRLGWTAENRPIVTVNPGDVPEQFRHLIPYVERWAISCDVRRGDYFDKQPPADIDDFYQTIRPHWEALNAWVDQPPPSDAKTNFMVMLKAYSEAHPPPSPEEITARHQSWADERAARRQHWREVARKTRGA